VETIGFLELNSIAKGMLAVDGMLKAADVKLISAKPGCPGKYNILISGEVTAVEAAMEAGYRLSGENAIGQLVIPRLHPQVIAAINMTSLPERLNAVGIIECYSIAAAIYAADTAAKDSGVTLLELRLGAGIGGKSFVIMTGDVASVEAGVQAGGQKAQAEGMLVNQVVIPSPHPDLFLNLY